MLLDTCRHPQTHCYNEIFECLFVIKCITFFNLSISVGVLWNTKGKLSNKSIGNKSLFTLSYGYVGVATAVNFNNIRYTILNNN